MKIARNTACPCGSGLKYKKCCLAPENGIDAVAAADSPAPLAQSPRRSIELGGLHFRAHGIDEALAELPTGYQHDLVAARRLLDEGCLRWRLKSFRGELPAEDIARLVRRGDHIEARAIDALEFPGRLDEIVESFDIAGCREIRPAVAVRRALDAVDPGAETTPERRLLARIFARTRQEWTDTDLYFLTSEWGFVGPELPEPAVMSGWSVPHSVLCRHGARGLPDGRVAAGWEPYETPARHALRAGWLTAEEEALLARVLASTVGTWCVVESITPDVVSVVPLSKRQGVDAAPVVARLPFPLPARQGALILGRLLAADEGLARFVELYPVACADPEFRKLLDESPSRQDAAGLVLTAPWAAARSAADRPPCRIIEVYEIEDADEVVEAIDEVMRPAEMGLPALDTEREDAGCVVRATGATPDGRIEITATSMTVSSDDSRSLSSLRSALAEVIEDADVLGVTWLRQERRAKGPSLTRTAG